jgi:hypothetical protein
MILLCYNICIAAKGPSTWWLEGVGGTPQIGGLTTGLELKKSHSSIPIKAYGKGPAVGRLGYRPLCMAEQSPCFKAQVKDRPMSRSHR